MAVEVEIAPCEVLNALAQFQFDVIRRLNRKFAALQRIAQLLEQIGDISVLIPDISKLLPVNSITLQMYAQLVQDCPFLGLPPASEANLAQLRQSVLAAYASLIRKLQNLPHLRMDKLQAALAKFQGDLNAAAAVANNYLQCLQTICDVIDSVGTAFHGLTKAAIAAEIKSYTKNFVQNAGRVLNDVQVAKVQQVKTAISEVKQLSTETIADDKATVSDAKSVAGTVIISS